MDLETVGGYFSEEATVRHYARAVANVGLWESERALLERFFERDDAILDLGCGAGRVALGLWRLGFRGGVGADLSEAMVAEAREIAACLGCRWRFERQDATALGYADGAFDAVSFAFNGLMQIPDRENRGRAMGEVARVLRPGGVFFFSTLDREDRLYARVFADRSNFEHDVDRNPDLIDFGDRHFRTEHGTTFMHVPLRSDVEAGLREAGFEVELSQMRSAIARESAAVQAFSEDCRLWVARRLEREER